MSPLPPPEPAASYAAAWPDAESQSLLAARGIGKSVHLTTFHDADGLLGSLRPFPWAGVQSARIAAVAEWPVGGGVHLVAEMEGCPWSERANAHYLAQGGRQGLPHRPHITLMKNAPPGSAAAHQGLVGLALRFDRHGGPECKPGSAKAPGRPGQLP